MWKKWLLGAVGVFLVLGLGLFFWVRSVLATSAVQEALASQISRSIGQPVKIAGVSARIYPRIGLTLNGVAIGDASQISVGDLDVGADFGALLSRRIEHATVRMNGARIQLPLPPLTLGSEAPATTEPADSPVEIVSIDEVVLSGIEIVSGGRTLKGDIDVVPQGSGVQVRTIVLSAEDMSLTATGQITDLAGPRGQLSLNAGALNVDRLLAFFNEFSTGLASPAAPASPAAVSTPANATPAAAGAGMNLTVDLEAERATVGGLTIDAMRGRIMATDQLATLEPLSFGLFGGHYDGALSVTLGTALPTFHWKAALTGVDVAAAMAYAGSPNTVTGTMQATIDISGTGSDAASAMSSVGGNVTFGIANGIVRNLGLIRSVGAATQLNLAGLKTAAVGASNTDEPFRRLQGSVAIANGVATTNALVFEADDVLLTADGSARLDGRMVDLKGRLQLSEALSAQVNTNVLKVSQEQGRVTLPATITGTLEAPSVRVDITDFTKRALRNTAKEAAPGLIKRGLGGLIRR